MPEDPAVTPDPVELEAELAVADLPGAAVPSERLGRNGAFVRLWTGETLSWFGENIGNFVIPIIAITWLSASAFEMGLLTTFERLAFLVIGLPAGAWVDRWIKRRTMLVVDLARALLLAAIPVLWLAGVLAFWQLLLIATLVGTLSVFFDVAYQSYVPLIVRREQIALANGRLETTAQASGIAGPALGGGLIAIVAAPLTLFITAGTYLLSFVALATNRDAETRKPKEERRPLVVEIKEGLVWVFRQPLLVRIVLCTGIGNLFSQLVLTLFPLLLLRDLGMPEWLFGVLGTIGGAAGVLGAFLAPRFSRWLGEGTVIPVFATVFGAAMLLVPLAAIDPDGALGWLIAAEIAFPISVVAYNVAQVSYRQRICPPELLGRMNASIRFMVWGSIPIGGFLAGVLATWLGMIPTLWIGAVGVLLSAAPVLLSRLTGMRALPVQAD